MEDATNKQYRCDCCGKKRRWDSGIVTLACPDCACIPSIELLITLLRARFLFVYTETDWDGEGAILSKDYCEGWNEAREAVMEILDRRSKC